MFFDLPEKITHQCEAALDGKILSVEYVGGGDINQARRLKTSKGDFFLKLNLVSKARKMFEVEQKGLELLAAAKTIRVPSVIAVISDGKNAGLLMEYIETGYRADGFWEKFGTALATLHRESTKQYGLDHDNFIGSLPQSNGAHDTWSEFYIYERLLPQIEIAMADGKMTAHDLKSFKGLFKKLPEICPEDVPSLTHGDLWSGNFLVSSESEPVLIDPAVSYAHREMDLAMSRLFGGFDRSFYRAYEGAWPLEPGFEKRLPIYQLYYLMVHVNLFGGGYVRSTRNILKEFV